MYKQLRFLATMLLLAVCCGMWADDTYVKITSASELEVGVEYLLAYDNEDNDNLYTVMGSLTTSGTTYGTNVSVTRSSKGVISVSASNNPNILTLGGESDKWTFKTSIEGKYISWSSGNSLSVAETVSENTQWKLTFTNGSLSITNVKDTNRKLQYNVQNPRFACYTSTQKAVALYKKKIETTPSISVTPNSINAVAAGTDGTITVTYNNISEVAADVAFYEADGTTTATYDWVTADINEENNVDYLIESNTGDARTAYMKVWAYDDDLNEVYSELITISQAAYSDPAASLGSYVKVTSTDDITSGQYLIVYEGDNTHDAVAFDGSLEKLDAATNTIKITISDNEIEATSDTQSAEFTLDLTAKTLKSKSGFYIGKTANSNGLDASSSTAYTNDFSISNGEAVITASGKTTLRYNSTSDQNRFRYYKSGQQAIQLYKYVAPTAPEVTFSEEDANNATIADNKGKVVNATLTRTLSGDYWSTFSVPFNATAEQVTAALGTGVELRKFQGSEGTVIKFEETDNIVAGHAYLVKPETTVSDPVFEGVTVVNTTREKDDDNNYGFVGAVIKTTLATDKTELFLGTDGKFYYPESEDKATMKGLRGYFMVPEGTETSKMMIDFDGIATTIDAMDVEGLTTGSVFNMNGQMVGTSLNGLAKGIYLMNGKKYIVK